LLAAAVASLAVPAAAQAAAPPKVDLHVEAGGRALVPGYTYQSGTTSFATDERKPACNGTGTRQILRGPTALGVLADASATRSALRPLGISDQFDFGLLVCGIGRRLGSDSAFWLYKVNHRSPEVGADQFKVRDGDEVLWYYSNPAANANVGDELAIVAPARARSDVPFTARVVSYDAQGVRRLAANATVSLQGRSAKTDAKGRIKVILPGRGTAKLRATRGGDIPSPVTTVCHSASRSDCPPRRTKRIYGTAMADRIRGTGAPDLVYGAAGNDLIDVRGGGKDLVRCGKGRDRVILSVGDRSRGCERVSTRRRATSAER